MNTHVTLPDISLLEQSHVYLLGIKGVGMTALALMLQEAGVHVSGADVTEAFVTDQQLHQAGIQVDDLATAQVPDDVSVVVYSGAHQGSKNLVVEAAVARGVLAVHLAGAVGLLSREQRTIAVCGVGGKSTTSALLSWMLSQAELPLSYAVGVGNIPNLGRSGHWDSAAEYFVVEADEYVADPQASVEERTPRFSFLQPHTVICTSLSYDHPDVYASFAETKAVFQDFFEKIPASGLLVYNGDDEALRELVARSQIEARTLSVGEAAHNDRVLSAWQVTDGVGMVQLDKIVLESLVPGRHNLLNAAYAAVVALELGVSSTIIQQAVRSFRSTQRRFEFMGKTKQGASCYDDYAHHPREILAISETLREWFPDKRVSLAFQPHTYSRTKALFPDFVEALTGSADTVLILPIFASAREAFDDSIESQDLVAALAAAGQEAQMVSEQAVLQWVESLGPDDVFITLGAGDVYKVYEHVIFE